MLETRVPDATTVVLVRDGEVAPEIFMARRSGGADHVGEAYVFPGGRVDLEDAALAAHCAPMHPRDRERLAAENLSDEHALACWVAAIRELFEETGVLLAEPDDLRVLHGEPFTDIVTANDLVLATDRLRYFSRFVAPPYSPKRYDTRFVIAAAHADLTTRDTDELVNGEWLTAERAIELYHSRERQIVPPTLQNLYQLAEAKNVAELFATCDQRVIAPVCPASVRVDGVPTIIYPGDRDYWSPLEPGFTSLDDRPADMPILRFQLGRDGRWDVTPGVPRKGASMGTTEERLHRLEAIAEIKELTSKYCFHVRRNEGDAIVDLFTEDGVLDGSTAGMGVISGREALLAFYKQAVTDGEESLPFIHNHIIEVSGDEAKGTCALEARFSRSGRSITAAGYYEDTYRRDNGRWLFAERKLFFHHMVPLEKGWAEPKR